MRYQPGTLVIHRATNGPDIGLVIDVRETEHLERFEHHDEWVTLVGLTILWPSGLAWVPWHKGYELHEVLPVLQQPR